MGTNPAVFTERADQLQDQRWAEKDQKQKMQLAPLTLALSGLKARMSNAADPNDPTKPLAGKEDEYTAAHDGMADVIGKMRMILHPPPREDPHGLGYIVHRATDKLHITNHAVQDAKDASENKLRKYAQDTAGEVSANVQGIPPDASANFKAEYTKATGAVPTPEVMEAWARKQGGIPEHPAGESFKAPQTLKLQDGTEVTAQQDTKSGKWKYLDGTEIPAEKLSGVTVKSKTPPKGLRYDKATGQVIDGDTGKRYNAGDTSNPPEAAAMFHGADAIQKKTQDFQIKMAAMRGSSYNMTRPLPMFDTENGNAPVEVTFGDVRSHPGRYLPQNGATKAIAQENMIQDIARTSTATRRAIMSLGKEEDFTPEMKAKILTAMRAEDPRDSIDQLLASEAVGSLTGHQQDFLVATRQLAENAMAMRGILGAGQGSDDVRRAIGNTLPGLLSPNRGFALKQLDAFDATINALHRGVPKVPLNNTPVPPQGETKHKIRIGNKNYVYKGTGDTADLKNYDEVK